MKKMFVYMVMIAVGIIACQGKQPSTSTQASMVEKNSFRATSDKFPNQIYYVRDGAIFNALCPKGVVENVKNCDVGVRSIPLQVFEPKLDKAIEDELNGIKLKREARINKLRETDDKVLELQTNLEEKKSLARTLRTKMDGLESEVKAIRAKRADANAIVEDYKSELGAIARRLETDKENAELKALQKELEGESKKAKEEYDAIDVAMKKVENELTTKKAQLESNDKTIESIAKVIEKRLAEIKIDEDEEVKKHNRSIRDLGKLKGFYGDLKKRLEDPEINYRVEFASPPVKWALEWVNFVFFRNWKPQTAQGGNYETTAKDAKGDCSHEQVFFPKLLPLGAFPDDIGVTYTFSMYYYPPTFQDGKASCTPIQTKLVPEATFYCNGINGKCMPEESTYVSEGIKFTLTNVTQDSFELEMKIPLPKNAENKNGLPEFWIQRTKYRLKKN